MIWRWVIEPLAAFLSWVMSPLPEFDLLAFVHRADGVVRAIARFGASFNAVFPMREVFGLAATVSRFLIPGVVIYVFLNWVYRHLPNILGTGPGGG